MAIHIKNTDQVRAMIDGKLRKIAYWKSGGGGENGDAGSTGSGANGGAGGAGDPSTEAWEGRASRSTSHVISGEVTVDDDGPADFSTIQEAINAASWGDTIHVKNGIYYIIRGWGFNSESWKLANGFIPGETDDEILISCYTCHPSLCNDNLSGVVLSTFLAKYYEEVLNNIV